MRIFITGDFAQSDDAQRELTYAPMGSILRLECEPTNKYDQNAIKVLLNGKQVGYVAKNMTVTVKPLMVSSTLTEGIATLVGVSTGLSTRYYMDVINTTPELIKADNDRVDNDNKLRMKAEADAIIEAKVKADKKAVRIAKTKANAEANKQKEMMWARSNAKYQAAKLRSKT